MKANELMIGDWAKFNSGYGKVTGITDAGVYFVDRFGGGIASGADPIPLTPEILEKNGFVSRDFYDELKVGEEWRIMCDTKQIAIIHGDHVNIDTPICYVHELQHALRLCRIEKEITIE